MPTHDLRRLLSPIRLGALELPHRVLMAPLTRSRSRQPGDVPWELNAEYYAQRARPQTGASLIIAEATQISPQAKGYAFTPGIYTDEQVAGWRLVTDAVHARGGLIALQLWHVGRISHVDLQPNGQKPVAPSAIRAEGSMTYTSAESGRVPVSEPRALETDEIPGVIEQFRHAAQCAKDAGFDAVEIHGANTYLLEQFLRLGTNRRTDAYGGPLENRARLGIEVAEAVAGVWGPDRVGYRVTPMSGLNDLDDEDAAVTFGYLAEKLGAMGLSFIHVVEHFASSERNAESDRVFAEVRDRFKAAGGGAYIGNGAYTAETAEARIASRRADAIAFGKLFISNPDLTHRFRTGAELAEWDQSTFYTGGAEGYTDYPSLDSVGSAER